MIGGLTLPTYLGAVMLLTLTLFLAWIIALSWPVTSPGGKAMRALVVGSCWWRSTSRRPAGPAGSPVLTLVF